MSVFRVEKNKNYTVMSNHHLKERQMSLKAKGLLSLMLSLPDNWNYTLAGLVTLCKENETAIRSALAELKKFGYLEIHQNKPTKDNGGRMSYDYIVYENPIQEDKKQDIENLYVENPTLLNTKLSNTNNNINIINNNIQEETPQKTKKLSKKQQKELAELEEATKINNLIDKFTDDPTIQDLLERYVLVRKQRGILTSAQFYIMLDDLKRECGQNANYTKNCIRQAIAGGWSQIVFVDKFKGNVKSSYSVKNSFDNTAGHQNSSAKITDDEFSNMSFEDKKYYIGTMAVADMTPLQKEFFDEYCLAKDEDGNILKF